MGMSGRTVMSTSTRVNWKTGDSGSVSGTPLTAPAPVIAAVHWAVFAGMVTPTTREQTRIDTVVDDAIPRPMLLRARLETTAALGCADCAGDEVP